MFCGNCGKKLEDEATKCPECGAEVDSSEKADVAVDAKLATAVPTEVGEAATEIPTEVDEAATEIPTEVGEAISSEVQNTTDSTLNTVDFGSESSTEEALSYGGGMSEGDGVNTDASYVATEAYSGNGGKKRSGLSAAIIAACAVVAAALIIGCYFLFRTPTINLNEYLEVEFEGYDTVGKAKVEFNASKMYKEYKKALTFREGAEDEIDEDEFKLKTGKKLREKAYLEYYFSANNMVENVGTLDFEKELSNDDEIKYTWNIDKEKFENYFKCKIKCDDMTFKVNGLKKAETFDPFKEIEVTFSGIAPFARADYINNFNDEFYRLRFEFEDAEGKQYSLKNGDKVTLVLTPEYYDDVVEYCITEFEKIPSVTKMEFEVKGLEEYITKASQVKEADLNTMKQDSEAYLNESYLNIDEGSLQYVGTCFMFTKEYTYGSANYFHLIYKYTRPASFFEEGGTRYISVRYSELKLKADGSLDVDLALRSRSSNGKTIDEWYENEISRNENRFNIEKNYTEE